MRDRFRAFAAGASRAMGSPVAFALALGVVLLWAAAGPWAGYSERWQLVINTGTTILTFLMVFLIQHSQNVADRAIQTKLDELIRAGAQARNAVIGLDEAPLDEIERTHADVVRHRGDG